MVDLMPTCDKLRDRSERILGAIANLTPEDSREILARAGDLKTAIIMTKRAVSPETARQLLKENGGIVRRALNAQ